MADHQETEGSPAAKPRIALPKNIAQTLQFLNDIDLETLRLSVDCEEQRRRSTTGAEAAVERASDDPPSKPSARKPVASGSRVSLPAGKVSLIRASAESGIKPTAIARTLRISLADVNRAMEVAAKPKR